MTDELATLDALKGKLNVPLTDTSRDVDLALVLAAATRHVLDLTRYALTPTIVTGELHENVLEGAELWSGLRPIDTAETVTVRGRVLGATDWSELTADVVDPVRGKLRIIGVSAGLRLWPPPAFSRGLLRRSRAWRWPVLELAYTTAEPAGLEDLAEPTAAIAAFLVREGERGNLSGETVGQVAETYASSVPGTAAFPPALDALLGAHVWPKARLAS